MPRRTPPPPFPLNSRESAHSLTGLDERETSRRKRPPSAASEEFGASRRRAGQSADSPGPSDQNSTGRHRGSDSNSSHEESLRHSSSIRASPRLAGAENMMLRRREANRLAAQRFRSRKKGYQESLEEKVRQLEEDKGVLMRRWDNPAAAPPDRYDHHLGPPSWRTDRSRPQPDAGPSHLDYPNTSGMDPDVRIAGLEAANRRLQDELRLAAHENHRLSEELKMWQQWGHSNWDSRNWPGRPQTGFARLVSVVHSLRITLIKTQPELVPPSTSSVPEPPSAVRLPPIRLTPPPRSRGPPPYGPPIDGRVPLPRDPVLDGTVPLTARRERRSSSSPQQRTAPF